MLKKLENYLKKEKAKFDIVEHRKVFTAHDAAMTQGVDEKIIAKALLIKMDKDFAFALLSAKKKVDFNKVKKLANKEIEKLQKDDPDLKKYKKVSIAKESDIKKHITKDLGAIAPFGSLYGIKVYADAALLKPSKIQLNAGSHTESLVMTPAQYKKLEDPIIGNIGK